MAALTPGNILTASDINDVTQGDASEISGVNGATVQTLVMPYANTGTILDSGIFALAEEVNSSPDYTEAISTWNANGTLRVRNTAFPLTISPSVRDDVVLTYLGNTFYIIIKKNTPSSAPRQFLYTFDVDAVIGGTSWTLPADAINAWSAGISPDGTILYYGDSGGIHRYDLINNIALSDLVDTSFYTNWARALIVTASGQILSVALDGLNDDNFIVIDPDGTIALAVSLLSQDNYEWAEMFTDLDSDYIWIRNFPDATGETTKFWRLKISDGSVSRSFTVATLEGSGVVPSTCPNLMIGSRSVATGSIIVNKTVVGDDGEFDFIAANLTPGTFSLSDGESQAFEDLAAGSGYGIAETANPLYTTSYTVSNGSPINNITVAAGEVVIINYLNTKINNLRSGIYKIVPDKRNDTLWLQDFSGTEDVKIP